MAGHGAHASTNTTQGHELSQKAREMWSEDGLTPRRQDNSTLSMVTRRLTTLCKRGQSPSGFPLEGCNLRAVAMPVPIWVRDGPPLPNCIIGSMAAPASNGFLEFLRRFEADLLQSLDLGRFSCLRIARCTIRSDFSAGLRAWSNQGGHRWRAELNRVALARDDARSHPVEKESSVGCWGHSRPWPSACEPWPDPVPRLLQTSDHPAATCRV